MRGELEPTAANKGKGFDRVAIVSMEHVVKLVPLPAAAKEPA